MSPPRPRRKKPAARSDKAAPPSDLATLVRRVEEAEAALQAHVAAAGQVDAIVDEGGRPLLLRAAQSTLISSEAGLRHLTEELQLERARLVAAQAVAKIGSWETDLTTLAMMWSAETHRIFGTDPAAFAPTHAGFLALVHPEDRAAVDRAFAQSRTTCGQHTIEHRLLMPDGRIKFVEERWQVVCDAAARPLQAVGTCQEITERKQAELALRESNEKFHQLVDNITDVFWIRSADMREVHYISPGFEHIWGRPLESMRSNPGQWIDFIVPEDRARVQKRFAALTRDTPSIEIEYRIARPDGEIRWVRARGFQVRDAAGRLVRLTGIASDITARKRADEQLRLLDACVANLNDIVVITEAEPLDEPGPRILYVNEAFVRLTGYTRAETIGPSPRFLQGPRTDRGALDRIRAAMQNRQSVREEIINYSKSGGEYWLEMEIVPVADAAGRVTHAIAIERDITERKLAEQELRRTNRALQLLSSCNEALIRAEQEKDLLQEICRIAVEQGGYRMAWVGYAEENEQRTITPIAHAGVEEGYLVEIKVTWDGDQALGQGPAGQVIRSGQAVVCEDLSKEPAFGPWMALARERGYSGVICLPLREAGRTFGLLGLYTGEVTQTGVEELKLLQELADDLAFGIFSLRARLERKRAQEALRASEAEFRGLAEAMPQIVWVTRADGENIYINQQWMEYTGMTKEQSVGDGWIKSCHPDDQQRVWAAWEQAMATGIGYSLECRLRRADGVCQWWLIRCAPQLGPKGEIVKWFGTCTDIDEFKRAQMQIAEQAALIDEARDAIIVRDMQHLITFWSRGAERLYGWTSAEALGRSMRDLLRPTPEKFNEALGLVLQEGAWSGEIQKITRSGTMLTLDARWTLLRDAAGQPKSILTIDTDITERKKLEQQFLRAQRMESIGTLAGGIAHDLNNLLAPITMGVDLLKLFDPPPRSLPVIENIERSAKRGAELVKQVLSFARGVEGARVALQVRHILNEVEVIATNTFPKNITVKTSLPRDLWPVLADPTQLSQVVMNLCVNARDAMPNGGGLELAAGNVEIDAQYAVMNRGVAAGRYVVIQVTDTGIGMPKEIIDRIFEPFFTTKELGKGTGLGLSTVLGIVRSHGGFVNVYSETGKGSTFKVYLPAHEADEGPVAHQHVAEALPRGNGELILVVDDETSILDITKQTLQAFGYRVMTAEDGAHAIGLYAQHRDEIAVVLTDMMMPVMDGPALIIALRRVNPAVRLIAASGLAANGNMTRAAGAGVKHFLAKPYSADTLLTVVREVLRAGGSRPPM